jgi:hypothetical protein
VSEVADVTVRYFDGCPNWQACHQLLRRVLEHLGQQQTLVTLQALTTAERAGALGFRGSPTILTIGRDRFADPSAPVGLSCRVFTAPEGLVGSPTFEQLLHAFESSVLPTQGEATEPVGVV